MFALQASTVRGIAAVAVAICLPQLHVSEAAEFYVLSEPERAIYRINTASLDEPVRVGSLGESGHFCELLDLGDGRLASIDSDSDEMVIFDVGEHRRVGQVTIDRDVDEHLRGFAIDSKGKIFGVFPGMKLLTIDPKTGTTESVATLSGAARIESIAFGPGDRLFASGSAKNDTKSERLYRIDLLTGKLDAIEPHGFSDVDTLTFGGDSYFYGTNSRAEVTNELLRLSARGEKGQVVGDTGVHGVNGIVRIAPDKAGGK